MRQVLGRAAAVAATVVLAGASASPGAVLNDYMRLGMDKMRAGHYRQAIALFQAAADSDPRSGLPYVCMGIAYRREGTGVASEIAFYKAAHRDAAYGALIDRSAQPVSRFVINAGGERIVFMGRKM